MLESALSELTVVSYGGPDVGLLARAQRIKRLLYGFVSLDSIPLEPHFRQARQRGAFEAVEMDEGMLWWGLYAAALKLPFLPTRRARLRRGDALKPAQNRPLTRADCEELSPFRRSNSTPPSSTSTAPTQAMA